MLDFYIIGNTATQIGDEKKEARVILENQYIVRVLYITNGILKHMEERRGKILAVVKQPSSIEFLFADGGRFKMSVDDFYPEVAEMYCIPVIYYGGLQNQDEAECHSAI